MAQSLATGKPGEEKQRGSGYGDPTLSWARDIHQQVHTLSWAHVPLLPPHCPRDPGSWWERQGPRTLAVLHDDSCNAPSLYFYPHQAL